MVAATRSSGDIFNQASFSAFLRAASSARNRASSSFLIRSFSTRKRSTSMRLASSCARVMACSLSYSEEASATSAASNAVAATAATVAAVLPEEDELLDEL